MEESLEVLKSKKSLQKFSVYKEPQEQGQASVLSAGIILFLHTIERQCKRRVTKLEVHKIASKGFINVEKPVEVLL